MPRNRERLNRAMKPLMPLCGCWPPAPHLPAKPALRLRLRPADRPARRQGRRRARHGRRHERWLRRCSVAGTDPGLQGPDPDRPGCGRARRSLPHRPRSMQQGRASCTPNSSAGRSTPATCAPMHSACSRCTPIASRCCPPRVTAWSTRMHAKPLTASSNAWTCWCCAIPTASWRTSTRCWVRTARKAACWLHGRHEHGRRPTPLLAANCTQETSAGRRNVQLCSNQMVGQFALEPAPAAYGTQAIRQLLGFTQQHCAG